MRTPDWQTADGNVKLYCGDCLELLKEMDEGSVDAVVTDPPYGVGFSGKYGMDSGGYENQSDEGAGPGPACVLLCVQRNLRSVIYSGVRRAFEYPQPDDIGGVYCPSGIGCNRWGFVCFHPVLFYGKDPHYSSPNSFAWHGSSECKEHPCAKPIHWMQWAVRKASVECETILDPFMGSGTTGVACVRTGRKFIGMEIERKYFDIAVKRIEAELNRHPLLEAAPKILQRELLPE